MNGGDPALGGKIDRTNSLVLSGGQPETLDPALTHGGPAGPVGSIFSGLVSLGNDLSVQPELAAGWEVSPDGTVYTFYLRPDARFHDGRPVTAADVIFSWERALRPETGSDTALTYLGDIVGAAELKAGQVDHLQGLRAIDDQTLEVQIDAPKIYFLSKLTYPVAYVVDQQNIAQPDWEHAPNGTGPFRLLEWQDDEIMRLGRNEAYYLSPATIDQVVYLMGAGIPLTMYEKGEIDLVGVGGSTLERMQDPNNPLAADLQLGVNMCTSYIGFNNRQPPFDDPLVRRAFSQAIDRDKLISGLYHGNALLAEGPLPPGMPGYTGKTGAYPFDPVEARAILAQAGYADPSELPPITFLTSGYGQVSSLTTALITMWQDNLGVEIEPRLIDPYDYLDELYAGRTGDIYSSGWCADYPDPENFLDVLFYSGSAQNLSGYSDPEVDQRLAEARVESNVQRRLDSYAEIEKLIVADAPALFLTHSLSAVLVKPYLHGYVQTPIGVAQWQRVSLER